MICRTRRWEDALYDSLTMRNFAGIDLGREPAPDETTVCKFRHLLERHGLSRKLLKQGNGYLERHGLKIGTSTIVDATLIEAPSSTKNKSGERDPEMHQVRKGKQWYFGMKARVRVDAETKLIHSVASTAANVADSRMLAGLLHGEKTEVWGDQAYQGQAEVIQQRAPKAADRIDRRWRTKLHEYPEVREENRIKSKARSRVEYVFAVIKLRFGFTKVRYRGPGQEPSPAVEYLRARQPLHRNQTYAGSACAEPRLKTCLESSTSQNHPPTATHPATNLLKQ